MNCFIAVHHRLLRDGIMLLLKESGLVNQFTAEIDLKNSLSILTTQKFDIIIIELVNIDRNLCDTIGLDSIRSVKKAAKPVPIIAITNTLDYSLAEQAISLGASASISLKSTFKELKNAIESARQGGTYISSELLDTSTALTQMSDVTAIASLSKKQKEVLTHITRGESNKVISTQMSISTNTVKAHLSAIFRTLGVHNRTEALRVASRAGLLPHD